MLIALVRFTADIITWLVFIYILLSFIVPPYNTFRLDIERIVAPLLNPIRKRIPPAGMFDFSPLVLILLVILAESILVSIISIF